MKKLISIFVVCSIIFLTASCSDAPEKNDGKADNAAATTQKEKYDTFTGLKPLEKVIFKVTSDNYNLSHNKIEHSYGVAKNNKPHNISIESQNFFESKGFSAITYDSATDNNIYLTFDCGYENGYTSKILDVLKEKNIKAAFFCTLDQIKSEPELIARMINEGHIVGNHSTTHPSFDELNNAEIAKELEECENYLRVNFGYSSEYFRFPQGNYSEFSLDAINSLGFKCIFWSLAYADWDIDNYKGSDYAFEKVTSRLHPGAIILLHSVSKDNAEALVKIIDYAEKEGYNFASLDDLNFMYSNYIT